MQVSLKRGIEFFLIFIITPISFIFPFNIQTKLIIGFFGFIYVLYILLAVVKVKITLKSMYVTNTIVKEILIKFLGLVIVSIVFVYFIMPENLFSVVLNKPLHWLKFIGVYILFSVYPQELLYRTFFFKRYERYFSNTNQLYFVNAIIFSLGHLFFKNALVLIIAFIGGYLFCKTYHKTQSIILVSVEHAIYGSWLFTVGMGEMLGFPV